MSNVVEVPVSKAPIIPRFTDPLNNAEITEGQRWVVLLLLNMKKDLAGKRTVAFDRDATFFPFFLSSYFNIHILAFLS